MSSEYLREFVNERLTAAAQEILGVFKTTIRKYEEEIDRQRRLLDIVYKPVIKLHRIELPQQHVCKEEEVLSEQQLCIQERNSSVDQEDPEPPQIKEEEEELCSSQEGEQLVLKQETDASTLTPTHEERDHSEDQTLNFNPDDVVSAADKESAVNTPVINSVESEEHSYHQLLSHSSPEAESQDQRGGKHGDSGSSRNAEPKPKRRRHKSRSHSNNVNNPNTHTELPQQHVCKEEEVLSEQQLCIQERNQEDPEPPQIKEEEEELCSSQEGEQLVLKQETDASMLTPTHEERDHSEDQTLNVSPDDAVSAANQESAVNMPVINSVVSAAHSYHQLLSHSSLGYNGYLIKQTGENLYLCKTGGIQFYKMSVLKSHTRTVNPHSCDTCGKDFKYKTRLKAHMRSHADERPFSCDTCGKHFKYKHGFLIHMRNHAGEKLYVCKNCGKAFNNKFVLTRHMTTHTDEKPHSCETCGRAFRTKEALVFHTRRVHIGERPHCCSTCGKTFFDKSSLNSHVKSHTDERPFPCNTCGKGFRTNRDLKGHIKIHAGEKVKTLKNSQT